MTDELMVMTGQRIALRRQVDGDLDFLAEMLGDAEVMRYWPRVLDRAGAEESLRRQQQRYIDDGCGYWLAVDTQTHRPIGQAGVLMTEIEGERLPSLGYMIHRPFWRQGYGLEAASLSIDFIYHTLDQPTAYTLVRPENKPSIALAHKLGMKPLRTVEFAGFKHQMLARDRKQSLNSTM